MSTSCMSNAANPYDEVPFPSQPLRHTQPARLEAIAAMFGMRPAPVERCRVLELGCATGGNLLPLADRYPEGRFVGIDYSQVQIDSARRAADALGLKNLELRCASIADLDGNSEPFDYILCHGVYSWVPREVQDAILSLCRTALAPQGVAYVSYNTYPAWHLRSLARRVMRDAAPGEPSIAGVARGRRSLAFLSSAIAPQQTPYGRLLAIELDAILRQPDEYLFHEYFEGHHEPLYFHEFADRAAAAELQYLGDAELATMFASNYGRATAQRLRRVTDEPIAIEQHLDLLCNRGFRKTLLCRQDVEASRRLLPDRLEDLYFSAQLAPRDPALDLRSWSPAEFAAPDGSKISHSAPPVKALLYHFGVEWPRSLSIDELATAVARLTAAEGQTPEMSTATREGVVLNVVQCLASGLVEPTSAPDNFTTTVSRCPQVSRVARRQAQTSSSVTNRRHESVGLDEESRRLLEYLDGQHDQDALLAALRESVLPADMATPGGSDDTTVLAGGLQKWLTTLAAQALLIG